MEARNISLREITKETLRDILHLKVSPNQEKFVFRQTIGFAPNGVAKAKIKLSEWITLEKQRKITMHTGQNFLTLITGRLAALPGISLFCALALFAFPASSHAQSAADSISLIFPKILVQNGKGEVLLVFDKKRQAWEVPGYVYAGPITLKGSVDTAARDLGITCSGFKLAGLFSYLFPNRYSTYLRPYFLVKFSGYADGHALRDTANCRWFKPTEAVRAIPYPASARIVERVLARPGTVWYAAFEEYGYTSPLDRSKIKFRIIEDFSESK